jgi:hypothetical protein
VAPRHAFVSLFKPHKAHIMEHMSIFSLIASQNIAGIWIAGMKVIGSWKVCHCRGIVWGLSRSTDSNTLSGQLQRHQSPSHYFRVQASDHQDSHQVLYHCLHHNHTLAPYEIVRCFPSPLLPIYLCRALLGLKVIISITYIRDQPSITKCIIGLCTA